LAQRHSLDRQRGHHSAAYRVDPQQSDRLLDVAYHWRALAETEATICFAKIMQEGMDRDAWKPNGGQRVDAGESGQAAQYRRQMQQRFHARGHVCRMVNERVPGRRSCAGRARTAVRFVAYSSTSDQETQAVAKTVEAQSLLTPGCGL
jgi:hypothetical protein